MGGPPQGTFTHLPNTAVAATERDAPLQRQDNGKAASAEEPRALQQHSAATAHSHSDDSGEGWEEVGKKAPKRSTPTASPRVMRANSPEAGKAAHVPQATSVVAPCSPSCAAAAAAKPNASCDRECKECKKCRCDEHSRRCRCNTASHITNGKHRQPSGAAAGARSSELVPSNIDEAPGGTQGNGRSSATGEGTQVTGGSSGASRSKGQSSGGHGGGSHSEHTKAGVSAETTAAKAKAAVTVTKQGRGNVHRLDDAVELSKVATTYEIGTNQQGGSKGPPISAPVVEETYDEQSKLYKLPAPRYMHRLDATAAAATGNDNRPQEKEDKQGKELSHTRAVGAPPPSATSQVPCDIPREWQESGLTAALSTELLEMASILGGLSERRRPWIMAVYLRLSKLVAQIWPAASVEMYGSSSTGLAIPASDLDVVATGLPVLPQWGSSFPLLQLLTNELGSQGWVSAITPIENTTVPIIKMECPCPRSTVKVDISFDTPAGSHRGRSTTAFVQRQQANHPLLTPLMIVLKQLLLERGLNDAYTGGLSSYALTVMVTAVLQRYALNPPHLRPDLGSLFLICLKTFGTSFDTRRSGVLVSSHGAGPLAPLTLQHFVGIPRVGTPEWWQPADPVVIQDPLQASNNVGRSCFGFRQVQVAFDRAYSAVANFYASDPGYGSRTASGAQRSESNSVLGAVFGAPHHKHVANLTAQVWCSLYDGAGLGTGRVGSLGGHTLHQPLEQMDMSELLTLAHTCVDTLTKRKLVELCERLLSVSSDDDDAAVIPKGKGTDESEQASMR
ncbi:unnamed protein product [Chrysoparadoxa australica]